MEQTRKVQYWATFAVSLAALTASVSRGWTTCVIPKFHNNETNIYLSDTDISWLAASAPPGMTIGCLGSGLASDRYGRKNTLLGSAFPFILGTIFVVSATKAWMLWVAKFCWGLGIGVVQAVSMVYISEIAAKEIRGSLSSINRFMFSFGAFIAVAAGSLMSYQTLSYMLIVLPVCYFGAFWWVPETPYYLLKEGKVEAAKKVLMNLNGYKDEVLEENLKEMQLHVSEDMKQSGTFRELFTGKQYRKAIIISIGLRVTQTSAGAIVIYLYLGRILQEANSKISVSTGLIIYSAVRFISSLLVSFVVDNVGRRPLIIYSYIISALILISLGIVYFYYEFMNQTFEYLGYLTLFGLTLLCIVVTLGYNSVIFFIPAELFPLNVKSRAMTALNILVNLVTFINVRGYQILKDFSGFYGVLWFFAIVSLVGAVFTYVAVPETKGKSLKEIQLILQGEFNEDGTENLNKICANLVEEKEMNDLHKSDELTPLK